MKTSTRSLLAVLACAAGGCEWIAGIEDTTVRVDAAQAAPADAQAAPDSASLAPDTGPPSHCPAPCAGDAFGDYDGTTTGANGRWGYVEVSSSFDSFVAMSGTIYPGGPAGGSARARRPRASRTASWKTRSFRAVARTKRSCSSPRTTRAPTTRPCAGSPPRRVFTS